MTRAEEPTSPGRWDRVADAVASLAGAAGLVGPTEPVALALSRLPWTAVATMLLIALVWSTPGRSGSPVWLSVLAFAGYNLVVELVRHGVPRLRSFRWVPWLDLPIAGLLYYLNHEPGGPVFVSFFLAVITAAYAWSVGATVLYTAGAAVVVVAITPTLPDSSPTAEDYRQLLPRLVVLGMVGIGTVVLTRRLVREEATTRTAREEAARLTEVDRLRTAFVASVSHDLRTPLTAAQAALGFLATSAADRLRPDEGDLLANARRKVERLGVLITDLLTANQLEAGVLRLDREPIDLRIVVTDAMAAIHPLIRQKGQTLEVDLAEALPIRGDARLLEQVMVNLLANAHRHTPSETRIVITGRRGADEVLLTVSDDGPGVPPAELERIFRRFHRLGADGGSGLGLANARGIVDLHGGRIWAENRNCGGTVVHVALPLRENEVLP